MIKKKNTNQKIIMKGIKNNNSNLKKEKVEIKEERGKNHKVYKLENNLKELHLFSNRKHYKKDNSYHEIKNKLIEKENYYKNKSNEVDIKLYKDSKSNLFTIKKDIYEVSWKLLNSNISNIKVEKNNDYYQEVRYEEVYENVDLLYEIDLEKVKENLLIKNKRTNYEFEFELNTKNLNLELSEDQKNIIFYINEVNDETGYKNKKTIFRIPTPYMHDKNKKNTSTDVVYEIEKKDSNKYNFKIIADKDFINNENIEFPVTVDPILYYLEENNQTLEISTIDSKDKNLYLGLLYVGKPENYEENIEFKTIILLDNINENISNKEVVEAKLYLKSSYESNNPAKGPIYVHKVTRSINLLDVTWEDILNVESEHAYQSIIPQNKDKEDIIIDLTEMIKKGNFYGVVLKSNEGYLSLYNTIINDIDLKPKVVIRYNEKKNVDSDTKIITYLNERGKGSADLYSRNQRFEYQSIDVGTFENKIVLEHIYNTRYNDYEYVYLDNENKCSYLGMGKGWKTNYHQYIINNITDYEDINQNTIYYIDGKGNIIELVKTRIDNDEYIFNDILGLGLTYYKESNTLTTKNKDKYYFDELNRLIKIENRYNQYVEMIYENNLLKKVKNNKNDYFTFVYEIDSASSTNQSKKVLTKVTTSNNKEVNLLYSNNELIEINHNNKFIKMTYYLYNTNDLYTIKDERNNRLVYLFRYFGKVKRYNTLDELQESYDVLFRSNKIRVNNLITNRSIEYVFSPIGQCINKYELINDNAETSKLNVKSYSYTYKDKDNNYLNIDINENEHNYLQNGDFNSKSNWIGNYELNDVLYVTGNKSASIENTEITQEVEVTDNNKAFILTCFSKANSYSLTNGAIYRMSAILKFTDQTTQILEKDFNPYEKGWQVNGLVIEKEEQNKTKTINKIEIKLEYKNNNLNALFDNVKLTQNSYQKRKVLLDFLVKDNEGNLRETKEFTHVYIIHSEGEHKLNINVFSKSVIIDVIKNKNNKTYLENTLRYRNISLLSFFINEKEYNIEDLSLEEVKVIEQSTNNSLFKSKEYITLLKEETIISKIIDEENKEYVTKYKYEYYDNENIKKITSQDYNGITNTIEYDEKGRIKQEKSEKDTYIIKDNTYTYDDSNRIVETIDKFQNKNIKTYHTSNGKLSSDKDVEVINQEGDLKTALIYHYENDNIKYIYKELKGQAVYNEFIFENDFLNSVLSKDNQKDYNKYTFEYDGNEEVNKVLLNSNDYVSYNNKIINNKKDEIIYHLGNDNTYKLEYIYDDKYRLISINEYNNDILKEIKAYTYEKDRLVLEQDKSIDPNITYKYTYNDNNYLIKKEIENEYEIEYKYDKYDRLEEKNILLNNEDAQKYQYSYKDKLNNLVNQVMINDNIRVNNLYDGINRKDRKSYYLNSTYIFKHEFNFIEYNKTLSIEDMHEAYGFEKNYKYVIKNNKIKYILDDNKEYISYEYDELDRLVKEKNKDLNETRKYSYDGNGNISLIEFYNYEETNLIKGRSFNYYSNNKDLLKDVSEYLPNTERIKYISFNNYDNMGNPCKIDGDMLQWSKGNRLTSYKGNTYYYNSEGLRIGKKTSNNVDVKYYLDGSKIIREVRGNKKLDYYYDESGIVGFSLNGKIYLYIKNILNDIIGITDTTGTLLAEYVYDAYGNHKVCDDNETVRTEEEFIGNINPFRYRGYYYDVETQLYWVSSRYYSPELCRWISPDSIEYLDPQSINGLNLYCYCYNNPIMYKDSAGNFPEIIWIFGDIISGFTEQLGSIILEQASNYLNNPLTIKQAKKIIRKNGLNQSARSVIRQYSEDALQSAKFGFNINKFGRDLSKNLTYLDIGYTIYNNATSGNTTWMSDAAVDVTYIGMQTVINSAFTCLIPGAGWLVGIGVNLVIIV